MRQSKAYFTKRAKLRIAAKAATLTVEQLDKQLAKLAAKREKAAEAAETAWVTYTNFVSTKGAYSDDT